MSLLIESINKTSSGTKHRARDAMMSIPASIVVLNFEHTTTDVIIPLLPGVVFANDHTFASL